MKDKNTTELLHILNHIDNESELNTFVDNTLNSYSNITISDYLNSEIERSKFSKSEIIQKSGIQRNYAYQILQGTKNPGRDKLICLCIALKLDLKQTQKALTIAGEGLLYSKDKRDAIIIFSINKELNVIKVNELLYNMQEKLLNDI